MELHQLYGVNRPGDERTGTPPANGGTVYDHPRNVPKYNWDSVARRYVEHDAEPMETFGPLASNDNPPVAASAQPAGPVATLRAAGGYTYLGSPYSLYPDHDEAADIVAAAAAGLMAQGIVVYSPIAHGHYVSQQGDLPTSWEFWKMQCQPLIDSASALAVLKMEGWGKSVGLQYEIGEFRRAGKPVVFLDSEAGWRCHDVMDPIEAKHDREASRADWEYQFRKEQEAA